MSTNGVRLPQIAPLYRDAGLDRVNISADSLRPERIAAIARRNLGFDPVLAARAAQDAGLSPIKLNVVVMRGIERVTLPTEKPVRNAAASAVPPPPAPPANADPSQAAQAGAAASAQNDTAADTSKAAQPKPAQKKPGGLQGQFELIKGAGQQGIDGNPDQ